MIYDMGLHVGPVLRFFRMFSDVKPPCYGTKNSACADIHAYLNSKHFATVSAWSSTNEEVHLPVHENEQGDFVVLPPRHRALIPTGIILDIPNGYSVRAHPRSGLSVKSGLGLANSEGVIDEDFVFELKCTVINFADIDLLIRNGHRISQLEMVKDLRAVFLERITCPEQKTDRAGGFGSTAL